MEFTVTWTINIDADSPTDAAKQALEIQRDPDSVATSFTVKQDNSPTPAVFVTLTPH